MQLKTIIVATLIALFLWAFVALFGWTVYQTWFNKGQNEAIIQFLSKQQAGKTDASAAGANTKAAN